MRADLHELARDFHRRAIPHQGRYVDRPAKTDENGVLNIPPDVPHRLPILLHRVGEIANLMQEFLGKHMANT